MFFLVIAETASIAIHGKPHSHITDSKSLWICKNRRNQKLLNEKVIEFNKKAYLINLKGLSRKNNSLTLILAGFLGCWFTVSGGKITPSKTR